MKLNSIHCSPVLLGHKECSRELGLFRLVEKMPEDAGGRGCLSSEDDSGHQYCGAPARSKKGRYVQSKPLSRAVSWDLIP